jgi:hypothetical protein
MTIWMLYIRFEIEIILISKNEKFYFDILKIIIISINTM